MNNGLIQWAPGVTLEMVERQTIFAAYEHFKHNKTATSIALGISIRTLDNKFEKYQADDESLEKQEITRKQNDSDWLARSRGQMPPLKPQIFEERKNHDKASVSTETGFCPEPATEVPSQQPVSLPKRNEVQGVLQAQASANGGRSRR